MQRFRSLCELNRSLGHEDLAQAPSDSDADAARALQARPPQALKQPLVVQQLSMKWQRALSRIGADTKIRGDQQTTLLGDATPPGLIPHRSVRIGPYLFPLRWSVLSSLEFVNGTVRLGAETVRIAGF